MRKVVLLLAVILFVALSLFGQQRGAPPHHRATVAAPAAHSQVPQERAVETTMRFRTDGEFIAAMKAKGKTFVDYLTWGFEATPENRALFESTPAAQPGDVWRVRWYRQGDELGPIAGYAICCPQCKEVHAWTTALNCSSLKPGRPCEHSGNGSCWSWTGSAEDNSLSAHPSLYAVKACGWHGWLTNGILRG